MARFWQARVSRRGLFAGGTGPISEIDRIQTNGYNAGLVGGW